MPTAPELPRTYAIRTFGCQMNEHDSERIAGLLDADGLVPAEGDDNEADVIVLNTCCIRENADNKLYGHLGHLKSLKEQRPGLQIAVAGCLAQKDRDGIRDRAPFVDAVFGTHNVHRAAELLQQARNEGPVTEILDATVLEDREAFPSALPVRRGAGYAAWVTIQIGCDNSCAFCIVPAVRGPEISRPMADVVAEVEALAAEGVTEVTLLGQNVNSYGRDGAGQPRPMFAPLLRAVGAVEGIRRVRYTSPHPKDFRADTIAAMAETPQVCEHLHLPLQSGNDQILADMHRGYTGIRYLEKLAAARAAIADLAVTTDIIVGFPGETEAQFADTLAVASEARFDSAYTFIYSPRPGTEAAEHVDRYVDRAVIGERFDRLCVVIDRTTRLAHEARVGRLEEVVVEGPSRTDPDVTTGRTRQNKLVHFSSTPLRVGTLARVEVTRAGGHSLRGELVEVLEAPRHRTRIPVVAG